MTFLKAEGLENEQNGEDVKAMKGGMKKIVKERKKILERWQERGYRKTERQWRKRGVEKTP